MEYDLVRVVWKDIYGAEGSWFSFEEAEAMEPAVVETVGWAIVDNDAFLTISSSIDSLSTFCGSITTIPKGCVMAAYSLTSAQTPRT
tara:strand:+ start:426 stop:686 length:261 start_codon:yes stop_codon:yes gene_type:complete